MILSQVLCCGDNKAIRACCTDVCTCEAGALLCDSPNCQCNINHKECTMKSFTVSYLAQALHYKGKTYLPVLQELVKFYDNTIKMITIQKQEVLMIMQECSLTLPQEEKQIYLKLKNRQVLMAKDFRMILNKLMNESQMKIDERLKEVSQMTSKIQQKINKILNQLKQFEQFQIKQKVIQKQIVAENAQPNKNNLLQIQNSLAKIQNQKITSRRSIAQILRCQATVQVQKLEQSCYIPNKYFVMIIKPISNDKTLEYRTFYFKIINIPAQQQYKRSLFIGINNFDSTNQKQKYNYRLSSNFNHLCGIDNNKVIYGSSLSKQSNFSLQKNDVIRVDFDPKSGKLLLFKNNISTIINDVDPSKSWCLCVGFQQSGQQVQYLGEYDPKTNHLIG